MIVVLEDMQRLQLLHLDLSVLTAADSVLRTSVSAVTFVSTYDRTTDNHISATSSSKSTDYHKQASKLLGQMLYCYLREGEGNIY